MDARSRVMTWRGRLSAGPILLRGAAVALALASASAPGGLHAAPTAADVVWVHELETDPKLVGQEVVVCGRFSGRERRADRDQLKLRNSSVEFRIPPDLDPKLPSSATRVWVRVTGKLEKAGDKLFMRIKSAERISESDTDRYQAVAQRIGARDARAWNDLADRTAGLAKFYGDDVELTTLARDARLKGLRAEELALAADRPAELLALAGRAESLDVSEDEVRRMRHKALRWQFDALAVAATTVENWNDLAKRIAELLPESQTQLNSSHASVASQYRNNPLEVYETQKAFRAVCDRQFWIEVFTRSMLAAAEKPDADLMSLAQNAKLSAPDHPELARMLIERWAAAEPGKLATLPASRRARGVRKLAETYRTELGNRDRSRAVLREWLDERRAELGKRDADGRVQLARDYRSDIQDDEIAAKLLLEAIAIEPDLPNAATELQSLGYEKVSEGWVRKSDRAAAGASRPPEGSGKQAELQMTTPEQVRERLGNPKPEDVVRWATAGRVREQWVIRGPSDVYVTFQFSPSEGLRVISIKTDVRK